MEGIAFVVVVALLAIWYESRAKRRYADSGEPTTLGPHDIERWMRWIDRVGEAHLVAEGPFVRYGWIQWVDVRRIGERYEISSTTESDGMGPTATESESLDRAGLVRLLEGLCRDGRPVVSSREMSTRARR